MPQTRPQKALRMAGGGLPARTSVVKASGDSVDESKVYRNKNKNKIPKSVRYDLENALLGLCDVWFEEIKPHLVRNNIKVHADGIGGGIGGAAGGDHERLPTGAPDCSHLDPGAASDLRRPQNVNCVGYYPTLPTASRARSPRPPVPLSTILSSPFQRRPKTQTQLQFILPKRKCKLKNKWTQTEALLKYGHDLQKPTPQRVTLSPVQHRMPPVTTAPFTRCAATTKFFPRRHKHNEDPTFILNNPINILSEQQNNDKNLKVLYKSPNREEHSSVMNLVYTNSSQKKVSSHIKKVYPWR